MPEKDLPEQLGPLYRVIEEALSTLSPSTASADARYMLFKRAGLTWADIISAPERRVSSDALEALSRDLSQARARKPLSRIYGERNFRGLDFFLSDETLDPRIDTEMIVEMALQHVAGMAQPIILDLGTGSGCILVSILHECPAARGVGLDLSPGALHTARQNAARHGVLSRASFICGDWAEALSGGFDLVVSNPPYIRNQVIESLSAEVRNHDPILALRGGEDGMEAYKTIFSQLEKILKPGATGLFEIGYDQEPSIMRLSEESRFPECSVHRDSGGSPRVAQIRISSVWG